MASYEIEGKMEVICQPDAMVRRHMVRGFNEQVFYFESQDSADKIIQIKIDPESKDQFKIKEVWQLPGSRVVAFELDAENIQNDLKDEV